MTAVPAPRQPADNAESALRGQLSYEDRAADLANEVRETLVAAGYSTDEVSPNIVNVTKDGRYLGTLTVTVTEGY